MVIIDNNSYSIYQYGNKKIPVLIIYGNFKYVTIIK